MGTLPESKESLLEKVEECVRYIVANKDISIDAAMRLYNIRSSYTFYKYLNIIQENNPNLYNEFYSDRSKMIKGKYRKYTVMQAEKLCQYMIDNNINITDAAKALNISNTNARRFLNIIKDVNIDLYNIIVNDYLGIDKRKDESYLTRQKLELAEYILMDPEYDHIASAVSKFNICEQTIYNYIESLKDIDMELYNKVKEKVHTTGYKYRSRCRKEN